jgi:hypothetical protein
VTIEEVARDPRYLLHRVDPVQRQLLFRQTIAEAVRDAAFIDGRTSIWTGPPVVFPFDAAREVATADLEPSRTIFHMSFCGSTLLARLLDRPGKVLALKEPNCLVDLADWKTALRQQNRGSGDFEPILAFAAAMLARPWTEGEQILLKPSSWANNLIGDLPGPMDAVFVTIAREPFLEAVLRGGASRIAFAARLAAHLSWFVEGGPERLQAAIESTPEPIGKTARLALAAHDFELRLFERAIWSGRLIAQTIDLSTIEESPAEAASQTAAALQLGLDDEDINSNLDRWAQANAKADAAYSAQQRRSENEQVRASYGALIDDALAWADGALGPATLRPA